MISLEDEVKIKGIIDNWHSILANRLSSDRCFCKVKLRSAVNDLKDIIMNVTYLENKQPESVLQEEEK